MTTYTIQLNDRTAASLRALARKGGNLRVEVLIAEAITILVDSCATDSTLRQTVLEDAGERQHRSRRKGTV